MLLGCSLVWVICLLYCLVCYLYGLISLVTVFSFVFWVFISSLVLCLCLIVLFSLGCVRLV